MMRTLQSLALLLALNLYIPFGIAATAEISILKPVGGSIFKSGSKIEISFEATPGPSGDHVHLYLDDRKPVVMQHLKGSHTLDDVAAGKHGLCARIVDKAHAEIGVQDCVIFRVE